MATQAYVQAPLDGAGKKIDNVLLDTDKYRQVVSLGDPDVVGTRQKVTGSAAAAADHAAVVRAHALGEQADAAVVTDANGSVTGFLRGLVKWAFERMPASLGQKTAAESLPVVLANNSIPNVYALVGLVNGGEGLAGDGSTASFVASSQVTSALVVDLTAFEGTLTVEASINTLVWEAIPFIKNRIYYNSRVLSGSTATEQWSLLVPDGFNYIRVTCSGYVAGAADISYVESPRTNSVVHTYNIPMSGAAPTNASVTGTSAQVVAANTSRRGLILTNTSTTASIFLGFGSTAELSKGVALLPGGSFQMFESALNLGAINAIATATANLAIQEFT